MPDEVEATEGSPNMVRIHLSVPVALLEDAKAIAEMEGWKPAELFRNFWERGFAAYAEGSNKRLVNKGLREKHKPEGK